MSRQIIKKKTFLFAIVQCHPIYNIIRKKKTVNNEKKCIEKTKQKLKQVIQSWNSDTDDDDDANYSPLTATC